MKHELLKHALFSPRSKIEQTLRLSKFIALSPQSLVGSLKHVVRNAKRISRSKTVNNTKWS